ncbi:dipeptidylpeptidase [Coemansia sp. RSA 552]|nr:dipeptidylpeptidase [Coemansia sp. RSA 552]
MHLLGSLVILCIAAEAYAGTKPLDIRRFHSLHRAGVPVVSPSGMRLLFTQNFYSPEENQSTMFINMLDMATSSIVRLTPELPGLGFTNPLWFSDQVVGFMHNDTLYRQRVLDQGMANPTPVFTPPIDISSVMFRASSQTLTFTAAVFPNASLVECRELQAQTIRADTAQVYTDLWVRHWDQWMTPKKLNVFAVPLLTSEENENGEWPVGPETNLMAGLPPAEDPLVRWASEGYTVDLQGARVAFITRSPSPLMPTQTNVDLYLVSIDGSHLQLLTGKVDGIASSPAFSVDGKRVAWLQMETPGYEADIRRIYIHNIEANHTRSIARDWELSPESLVWAADGTRLFASVGDHGHTVVYAIPINDTSPRQKLTEHGGSGSLRRANGHNLVLLHSDTDKCANIYQLNTRHHKLKQLTDINRDILQDVYIGSAQDFWFSGALDDQVHGWLVKPVDFDPAKKYPLALLVHGGPQQANIHSFSYGGWNPNTYASAGFVCAQINFHGSHSYGQNFTDSIRGQWGSYPFEDLMAGLDYMLEKFDFIDGQRMVALGASYGGYMMNWFNANTKRFQALVNHDGMFSVPMFWYTTDELWFPEHDFEGLPYQNRDAYDRFNPERLAANFSTPTLFVHGARDYRISPDHSLAPFTLLRRKGIPAKLMFFPDENHLTTKPANSIKWHTEVIQWIAKHTNTTLPYTLEMK